MQPFRLSFSFAVLAALALSALLASACSFDSASPASPSTDSGADDVDVSEDGDASGTATGDAGDGDAGDTGDTGTSADVSDGDDIGDESDTTDTGEETEIPNDLGEPCVQDEDCNLGLCVADVEGSVCSWPCGSSADCGEGWICATRVDDPDDDGGWCWPNVQDYCAECEESSDCGTHQDACVELEGTRGCAQECARRSCPPGYVCEVVTDVEGEESVQCVPPLGTCAGCLDRDGDGYGVGADCLGPDCDDDDPTVYPGAPLLCDGKDNNCDGVIDAFVEECYTGPEGTLDVGLCTAGFRLCEEGEWGECEGEVTPMPEVCDGLDNSCDGVVDDFTEDCYGGPEGTAGVGICRAGTRSCTNGVYTACEGQVLPSIEICDGQDNSCDGVVDGVVDECYEGPSGTAGVGECMAGSRTCSEDGGFGPCEGQVLPQAPQCNNLDDNCDGVVDDFTASCYEGPEGTEGVGECRAGQSLCTAGEWGACEGQVLPQAPQCNNLDDNCDGVVDDFSASCWSGEEENRGVGECRDGTRVCTAGEWSECTGERLPRAEQCNNRDDDCDGVIDDFTEGCYSGPEDTEGVGECRAGTRLCTAGEWGGCEGEVTPQAPQCNNLDDNCDGVIDDFDEPCYDGPEGTEGVGVCRAGWRTCTAGEWGACEGQVLPSEEVCDGRDNNCNGEVDEVCDCTEGDTQSCYSGPDGTEGVGVCQGGTQTCTGGSWGPCEGQVLPSAEVCDGQDNSCNGTVDQITRDCYDGPGGTEGVGVCRGGTQTCTAGDWGACEGQVLPSAEVCDGQDNSCNGVVDQITRDCYDGPAGTEDVGVCQGGTQTCTAGTWGSCEGQVLPSTEICDGLDNNCNGTVDGIQQSCYTGPSGTRDVGVCQGGTRTCTAGTWGSCEGQVLPSPEICDGLDNSCDGTVDAFSEACYTGPSGTRNVGECNDGSRTCTDGTWSACEGETLPAAEVCDGLDNSCNGTVDGFSEPCYDGPDGTQDVGICRGGTRTCTSGSFGACSGQVLPLAEEICGNGLDDTCSGTVDDGCALGVDRANSTVTTTSACLTAGAQARAAVVVNLIDTAGDPLTGATVTMTTTSGSLSAVTASGAQYHAILTSPGGTGSGQVTVTANGQQLNTRPTVTFAAPMTDTRGGAGGCPAEGNLRVRVVDMDGNPLSGARVLVGNAPASTYTNTFGGAANGANSATTDAQGYVRFTDYGDSLRGAQTVTAGATNRGYLTLVDVDAADIVLPIDLVVPDVQTGTFTGDLTPLPAPANDPIELGIQLPDLSIDTLATFSLGDLLGDNQCYAAGGVAGDISIPSNIFIPAQCAVRLVVCVQNLPKKPFISGPIPYGPNRLVGLGGSAPLGALTGGDITGALGRLTFDSVGVASVTASAPGPTERNVSNLTAMNRNASCAISNHPPNSDVFCATIGDWDSAGSSALRIGEGNLFLMGFRTVNSAEEGATFTIDQVTTVDSSGAFAGIQYAGAAMATYLDGDREGIPEGTESGISVVLERSGTVLGSGGGAMTMNSFFPVRTLERNGRTFSASALPASGPFPTAQYTRTVITQRISEAYTACEEDDSTRTFNRELWRIYTPGDQNAFTLPTLPTDWPRANLPGDLQGLVDPDATSEDDRLSWQSLTVHEAWTTNFSWDRIRFFSFRNGLSHISVNSANFDEDEPE